MASVLAIKKKKKNLPKAYILKVVIPFYIKVCFYKCTLRDGCDNIAALDNAISEADA